MPPSGAVPPAPMTPAPRNDSKLPHIIAAVFLGLVILLAGAGTLAYKLRSSASKKNAASTSSSSAPGSSSPGSNLPIVSGEQAKARDSKRSVDLDTIQTQLEAYFQDRGNYPTFGQMSSPAWRAANMQSLDSGALVDPSSSCDPAKSGCLSPEPKAGAYAYAVTDSSGKGCEADATKCARYTLTATLEGGGTVVKTNLD